MEENIIEKYLAAQKAARLLLRELNKYDDGFIYFVVISAYGSTYVLTKSNWFTAQEEAEKYTGDNGYANIYTNNLNHKIDDNLLRGGIVTVLSIEQMKILANNNPGTKLGYVILRHFA